MDWSQQLRHCRHWEKSSIFLYSRYTTHGLITVLQKWIIAFYPCTQINPRKSGHFVSCNGCNPRGPLCTGMERISITSSITTSTGTMASHGPLKIQTQRQVLQRRNTREILARFDINDTVAFSGRLLNCEHIQKDWGVPDVFWFLARIDDFEISVPLSIKLDWLPYPVSHSLYPGIPCQSSCAFTSC